MIPRQALFGVILPSIFFAVVLAIGVLAHRYYQPQVSRRCTQIVTADAPFIVFPHRYCVRSEPTTEEAQP
jgi:hypothetical protein